MGPPQPLQTRQNGLGEPSAGTAGGLVVGLAVVGAGVVGGYLIGGKIGAPKHKTAGKVIGAVAGGFILSAVVGKILWAAT